MSSTLIFVAVVLLALVDVVLCTKLLHKGSSFRSFVASKASRFTGRSVKHKTEDLLEAGERQVREQVEDILMGRRLWYASAVNTCMAVTALSVQPVVVVMLTSGNFMWRPSSVVVLVVSFSTSVMGLCCPRTVNAHTLPMWHCFHMFAMCIVASPLGAEFDIGVSVMRPMCHVGTCLLGFMHARPIILVGTNLCFAACCVWLYMAAPEPLAADMALQIAMSEVVILSFKLCAIWCIGLLLADSAEQEVRAATGQCQRSAVTALLRMMCDAVVDVDARLRMKTHEISLANMLMHGVGRCLRGAALQDFIPQGPPRDGFLQNIARNSEGAGGFQSAGMFGGSVRDSMGNNLRVVFYHVAYTTIAGTPNHLIGIREDTDTAHETSEPLSIGRAVVPTLVGESPQEVSPTSSGETPSSEASQSSGGGTSSAASSSLVSRHVAAEQTMTLDALVDDALTVRYATQSLRHKFEFPPGRAARFLDLVSAEEGRALLAWIHERLRLQRDGVLPSPHAATFGEVRVRSATARPDSDAAPLRRLSVCFPTPPERVTAAHFVSITVGASRPARLRSRSSRSSSRGAGRSGSSQSSSRGADRSSSRSSSMCTDRSPLSAAEQWARPPQPLSL